MTNNSMRCKVKPLLKEIESLRKRLENGNKNAAAINTDKMLEISKELDEKIVEYHRLTEIGG